MKTKYLKTLCLLGATSLGVNAEAGDQKNFGDEELANAFNAGFTIPIKFSTDFGELTVTLSNDANEEDHNYIRSHLLSKPGAFIEMSHQLLLKKLELTVLEEKMRHASMTPQNESLPLLELNKPLSAASAPVLGSEAEEPYMASPPPQKFQKLIMDNLIFPIKYQAWDSELIDKYAFPSSVLTVTWTFEQNDHGLNYADLNKFTDTAQFYAYLQSRLLEVVHDRASEMEKAKFEAIRPYLYI